MTYQEAIDTIIKVNNALSAFAEQHKGEPNILLRWVVALNDPENIDTADAYAEAMAFIRAYALANRDNSKVADDKFSIRDHVEAAGTKVSADRAARAST
jgi:hypothetical protein